MSGLLRKCRMCGLEAQTQKELELFMKAQRSPYHRQNICKKCHNKSQREVRKINNRYYLMTSYHNMKNRCYRKETPYYERYGGRGITVCKEWLDNSDTFIEWALKNGWRRDLTLDRVDNAGSYSPSNCRWISAKLQQMNRRGNTTNFEKYTRICSKCGVEKPITDFHRNKNATLGRTYACKTCRKSPMKIEVSK